MIEPGTIGIAEGKAANVSAGRGPDGNHDTQPTQCVRKQPTQPLTHKGSPKSLRPKVQAGPTWLKKQSDLLRVKSELLAVRNEPRKLELNQE